MLESYLQTRLAEKEILLMTHLVLGYPSFEGSLRIIEAMFRAGVDLMELQIPFSDPIADGPVILRANQRAIEMGATVQKSLDLAGKVGNSFDIPFLFMTYYNILFKYGPERFVKEMKQKNLKGAIIPDFPPEEGADYFKAMADYQLSPIMLFSPTTSFERMRYVSSFARGFVYCVARKGVTGQDTRFSEELSAYLSRCRKATDLPLAVGFGVKQKEDVDFLKGRAEIAVIGTQTIRIVEEKGIDAVEDFIGGLR